MYRKRFTASAMVAALGISGISAVETTQAGAVEDTKVEDKNKGRSDGQELYRAIFFAEGPRAEELAAHFDDQAYYSAVQENRSDDKKRQAYSELVNRAVTDIEAADPSFFEGFAERITSGDPYKVEASINEAEDLTKHAVPELGQIDTGGDQGTCFAVVIWSAAVAVNYVAGLNIETAAFVHHKFKLAKNKQLSGDSGSYSKEKLVADLAQALA